ncbi:MAG: cellulase family glycosylhydrolase [Candidatus Omnitrophica bacterium]|nr:cellulase family glycosylhydrolase [Candidatus Omnitrophota bacterium]
MIVKGVNLGGWLLMEGYILGARNIPESEFKTKFKNIYGRRELKFFEKSFRDNFIKKEDLKRISSWGSNCVRVPFHHKFFEEKPYQYNKASLLFIKKILRWANEYNLKVILDLHAACGSQNEDWHSDSKGKAQLWSNKHYRDRTYELWEYLASNLKNEKAFYGYDILNEAVIDQSRLSVLKNFYKDTIKAIRRVDTKHIIYLEGNNWGQQIDFLQDILSENIAISIHAYQPLNFTFNFVRNYKYPGKIDGSAWNKDKIKRYLEPYKKFSSKNKVDIYVGEFGVNYRGGCYGELKWLSDILSVFKEFGFGWTYWVYKAVANNVFPDGVLQYLDNPAWVKRDGPILGIENLYKAWKGNKKKIVDSWKSSNYWVNSDIVRVLKKYF